MIWAITRRSSSASSAARNPACSSDSDDIVRSTRREPSLRLRRLLEQHRERRYVGVPLHKRRHGAVPLYGALVQRPDLLADARAMIVDQERLAIGLVDGVAGQMNLADDARL